ncbi:MAG: hypothetical protein ACFCUQ_01230 [Kiloniellales bacterium]
MRMARLAVMLPAFLLGAGCELAQPQQEVARCDLISNRVVGTLMITGTPGEQANLEVRCDDTLVANCIALVPPGGNADSCALGPVPVNQEVGAYTCGADPVVGNPTIDARCRFVQ